MKISMSPTTYTRVVTTREQAHFVVKEGYAQAKLLIQDERRVRITVEEDRDSLSARQRNFFHGPVLTQISEQVNVLGVRYVPDMWKEYLCKLFVGYRHERQLRPFAKKKVTVKVRISTEELNDRQYSELIDKAIAHAVTQWGVCFHFIEREREAVRWQAPKRRSSKGQASKGQASNEPKTAHPQSEAAPC